MKLKENTIAKIIAVLLSYVMVLSIVISAAAILVMGYYKFYFSNTETLTKEILTDMADKESYHINNLLDKEADLKSYYKDKNVYYEIVRYEDGEIIDTNYDNQPYLVKTKTDYYTYDQVYIGEKNGVEQYMHNETRYAEIKVYIAEDMTKNDIFSVIAKMIEIGFKLRFFMIFILILALIGFIALICFVFSAAGHTKNGLKLNFIDLIPFDIITALTTGWIVLSLFLADDIIYDIASATVFIFVLGTFDYFAVLIYLMSFASRVKSQKIIKNTLIYKCFKLFYKTFRKVLLWVRYIVMNISLLYKSIIAILVVIFLEVIFFLIFASNWRFLDDEIWFVVMLVNIAFVLFMLYMAIILQKIKLGGERIAGGDLQYKINTDYMYGDFKEFSNKLNNINVGLKNAVDEKMRSERFKTELITNVSHDIKTPLTSIINYVDLIKKEKCENSKINEYITVLERQSLRLKKLTEDLMEASKASTGNIAVNLEICNVGVLLSQTVGEFSERLEKSKLDAVLQLPENQIEIMADGRHLWRVFDNLMNNVCKYSLENTRVYLSLLEENGKAIITFRNISKYQLNITGEELFARFVRGDSSRNTEGSGLGLSIAKSLIELQNGNMEILVDGDLFKVVITFELLGGQD